MKAYGVKKKDWGYLGMDGKQCPCCPEKYSKDSKSPKKRLRHKVKNELKNLKEEINGKNI